MQIDFTQGRWINRPRNSLVEKGRVEITTDPETDFWQRSYYGFRNDNAPALLQESADNFSFTARVAFEYRSLFDQCGLIIYQDSENWFKASVEYENHEFSRLGSVITNRGHSDWATVDIPLPKRVWYRLNRRGPDFLIESSFDGKSFKQMRIFHLHALGETTEAMGKADPPLATDQWVAFGLYACSPTDSSFTASFDQFKLEPCRWKAHS